jgi:transcriptional regulator with XRE-family HTH domain
VRPRTERARGLGKSARGRQQRPEQEESAPNMSDGPVSVARGGRLLALLLAGLGFKASTSTCRTILQKGMMLLYEICTSNERRSVSGDSDLGQVLRGLRESRGLSLKSAAQALGTDRHATIAEIESGKRKAAFAEVVKLAAVYGVSVADVVNDVRGAQSSGAAQGLDIVVALPRAEGPLTEDDRLALARLERTARDYADLKSVLGS